MFFVCFFVVVFLVFLWCSWAIDKSCFHDTVVYYCFAARNNTCSVLNFWYDTV